jgi:hypothetical protein
LLSFDGIICDAHRCCIIAMDRHFWLRMTHVGQLLPEYYPVLTVVEEGTQFGFRR